MRAGALSRVTASRSGSMSAGGACLTPAACTEAFKKAYPTRSAIERIIAWTATQNGRRVRLRYLGAARNDAWLHTWCAALNLRTLLGTG